MIRVETSGRMTGRVSFSPVFEATTSTRSWNLTTGDTLTAKPEFGNPHNPYAGTVVTSTVGQRTVMFGSNPRELINKSLKTEQHGCAQQSPRARGPSSSTRMHKCTILIVHYILSTLNKTYVQHTITNAYECSVKTDDLEVGEHRQGNKAGQVYLLV